MNVTPIVAACVASIAALAACTSPAPQSADEPAEQETTVPDSARIVIEGVAQNAKIGGLVETADGQVWVDIEWPDEVVGKRVRASGTWQTRGDVPVFVQQPGEPIRAGVPMPPGTDLAKASQRRVLVEVTWELAPAPSTSD